MKKWKKEFFSLLTHDGWIMRLYCCCCCYIMRLSIHSFFFSRDGVSYKLGWEFFIIFLQPEQNFKTKFSDMKSFTFATTATADNLECLGSWALLVVVVVVVEWLRDIFIHRTGSEWVRKVSRKRHANMQKSSHRELNLTHIWA